MSKNRRKTGLVHYRDGVTFEIRKDIKTDKLYIKGTDEEIDPAKVTRDKRRGNSSKPYDFSKPSQAQDLGDEWDDYAWSADDY